MSQKIFDDESYTFNFMPLLDAIFLLIIFFILTVTLEKEEKLLPLNLPVSENPVLSKLESAILIQIDKAGNYYLDEQQYKMAELDDAIAQIRRDFQKDIVLIRSAEGTSMQKILSITDLVRRTGIEKISFAVREN